MVNFEIINNICIIELSNGKANTINVNMITDLRNIIAKAKHDENLSGIILTAKGHIFSTGADIGTILNLEKEKDIISFFRLLDELLLDLFSFPKPFISAINGHSIGGGLLIQLCSDYCFVQKNDRIKFGFPEISIGMCVGSLMKEIISFVIDNNKDITSILYSGVLFNTEEAIKYGIVDEVVEEFELIANAIEKISNLSNVNPESFCIMKKVIRKRTLSHMVNYYSTEDYSDFVKLLRNEKTQQKLRQI